MSDTTPENPYAELQAAKAAGEEIQINLAHPDSAVRSLNFADGGRTEAWCTVEDPILWDSPPELYRVKPRAGKVVISKFCQSRDQKACKVPLQDILPEIVENFDKAKPGYRDGVVLVPLNPERFAGQIVTLRDGDHLAGTFKPRQPGELPRKEIRIKAHDPIGSEPTREHDNGFSKLEADPLVSVDAVLYSNATLAEDKDNSDHSADYEVIAIITKISGEEQPMPPDTLMANHFQLSGGTATNMTPEAFEAALRKSFLFWQDKTLLP